MPGASRLLRLDSLQPRMSRGAGSSGEAPAPGSRLRLPQGLPDAALPLLMFPMLQRGDIKCEVKGNVLAVDGLYVAGWHAFAAARPPGSMPACTDAVAAIRHSEHTRMDVACWGGQAGCAACLPAPSSSVPHPHPHCPVHPHACRQHGVRPAQAGHDRGLPGGRHRRQSQLRQAGLRVVWGGRWESLHGQRPRRQPCLR